jgi:hypothetical protein
VSGSCEKSFVEGEQHGAMAEKFMLQHATLQRDRDCDRSMLTLTMESEEEVNAGRLKVRRGRRLKQTHRRSRSDGPLQERLQRDRVKP